MIFNYLIVIFKEVISQYEALPFESLVIEKIITQDEYDQLKHFELVNECNRCLNILNNMDLMELERYKTTVHLMHVMFLFINRLVRIFDFMSSKIEIENKRIKSHLDDIYYNEVYLFQMNIFSNGRNVRRQKQNIMLNIQNYMKIRKKAKKIYYTEKLMRQYGREMSKL